MANIFDSAFIDVSVMILKKIQGVMPFDVYIKRADNQYTKLFPQGEPLDLPRVENYATRKGVHQLYVQKEQYQQYLVYVERVATEILKKPEEATPEDLVDIVKEMTDLTTVELLVHKQIDEKSVKHAAMTMKGCADLLSKDPKQFIRIFQLMTSRPYLMRHSLATALFSLILAKAEGLESNKTLLALGLGAMLHDVGMTMLTFNSEDVSELTPDQWKEVRRHPELGKRLLDNIKGIPTETKLIILQHHEQPNGNGYPNRLHSKEIYYLAKVVAIADSFSAMISKRPYREEAFSPAKAFETMDFDHGKFDEKLLETFKRVFMQI